jgi:hypothetical protein
MEEVLQIYKLEDIIITSEKELLKLRLKIFIFKTYYLEAFLKIDKTNPFLY